MDTSLAPTEIRSADKLVAGHDNLRPFHEGLYLWFIKLGDLTFIRYRDALETRNNAGYTRLVWCRIDDRRKCKSTKPTAKAFLEKLDRSLAD